MSHELPFVEVGRRITKLRGEMTQVEFAQRLGVDRKSVAGWEAGKRLPDGASLMRLVDEFGVNLNFILTGVQPYPTQSQSQRAGLMAADPGASYGLKPEERALLDNYRAAAPEGQKALRDTSAALAKSAGCVKKSG